METLVSILQKKLTEAILKAYSEDLTLKDTQADIAFCLDQSFGNYQCNSSLKIAKILKKNPREVAQALVSHLSKDGLFEKIEIAGPGFINLTLSPLYLSSELNKVIEDKKYLGACVSKKPQKIIVEFSSPNVAKQLHVGHLRSTIIGDCLARLFEFLGDEVLRLNHIGDWGTQFGMLIAYMKENAQGVLAKTEKTDLIALEGWYKESKKQFDEDSAFKKRAQQEVVNLQSGDKKALEAWQIICEISRKAYQEIYDLLDVKLIERGESYYNPQLKKIVQELEDKGLVKVSDGAKCIFLEGFKNRDGDPLPLMIQKSDGGYNYDTTDMAAMKQRALEEKAKRIIVVTDAGQSLHFQMIYAASIKAGYLDPTKVKFDHVTFGLVLGPDGKKFKTRSGETEKLIDLLYGAVDRAKIILQEKDSRIDQDRKEKLSHILGIDAIKYADLSCHRTKDYQFSYERMLKFEGNTAVFLLYSYVRVMGIKRKIPEAEKILKTAKIELEHLSEIALGLHLRRFGEVLESLQRELLPNRLTEYLYELANKFNAFFRDCHVVGDAKQDPRLALCELSAKILEKGLNILGLNITDQL